MSASPSTVPGDQYLGGLVRFLYRTIRQHLLLLVLLPLVAAALAYFAALQLPAIYTAQGVIRIGKVDGADAMTGVTAVSRINSPSFKQRVFQKISSPDADRSKPAQTMVGTLTARQEATDTVAVSARAATAKVRDVVIATAELLNEEQSRIWRPVEADIKEQLANSDATIAGVETMRQSLSGLVKELPVDPVSAVLQKLWMFDLISRNEQRLAAVTAERRALSVRLSPARNYPTALVDDAFVSSGFAVARPTAIAIAAGAAVFLLMLIGVMLRGLKAVR